MRTSSVRAAWRWRLAAAVAVCLAAAVSLPASLDAKSSSNEAAKLQRELEEQQKQAERERRAMERELERQRKEAERAAREAERERRAAEREAERERRAAEREAQRAAAAAEKAAAAAAREAAAAAKAAQSQSSQSPSQSPQSQSSRSETAKQEASKSESSKSESAAESPGKSAEKPAAKGESDDSGDSGSRKSADSSDQGKPATQSQKQAETARAAAAPREVERPPPATLGELFSRVGELLSGGAGESDQSGSNSGNNTKPAAVKPAPPVTTGALPKPVAGSSASASGNQKGATQAVPTATKASTTAAAPVKTEPAKTDPAKAVPAKAEPAKAAALPPAPPPLRVARAPWKPDEVAPDTVKSREVLALNLDARAIETAERAGFKVARTSKAFGISATTLIAPPHLGAIHGRRHLEREIPQGHFAFNKVYRAYRSASADQEQAIESRLGAVPLVPPPPPRPGVRQAPACEGERCYGWSLIDWTDRSQRCARGIKVGIVDTAIDYGHPSLRHLKPEVGSFLPEGAGKAPAGHGTGIAALLFGDRSSATPGLIPEARPVLAEAFYQDTDGQVTSSTVKLVEALSWIEETGVSVVNLSFSGPKDEVLEAAIKRLSSRGIVMVAAAGNEGPNAPPSYPAAYPSVIAVTAVDSGRESYARANRGNYIDVAAPGVRIWTARAGGTAAYESGTSFAAPFVAAMLASQIKPQDQELKGNPKSILQKLRFEDLGPPGNDRIYGRGLALAPEACQPGLGTPSIARANRSWQPTTVRANVAN